MIKEFKALNVTLKEIPTTLSDDLKTTKHDDEDEQFK
jgi:hypothetical protein